MNQYFSIHTNQIEECPLRPIEDCNNPTCKGCSCNNPIWDDKYDSNTNELES